MAVPKSYDPFGTQLDATNTNGRVTEPAYFQPNSAGGLAFIPRRSATTGFATTRAALQRFAGDSPLRLLSYLVDVHPAFGLAVWNLLRLTCAPDDVKIVAVTPGGNGAADEQDDGDTDAIKSLFESLPAETGGFAGVLSTTMLSAALTGLPFLECVPGARNKGLRRVWPVDSLTLRMNREPVTGDDGVTEYLAVPYQSQRYPTGDAKSQWVKLTGERFLWHPIDTLADDPYGRAPLAPALAEVLRDLALIQDLTDAVHNAAWPRLGFPFNFAEMYRVAKEIYGITDAVEAEKWVLDQYAGVVEAAGKLKPSDNVHFDAAGKLETIEGSKGFAALEPILIYLRQRIVQACKSLPTLLGINDGSTQTYTSIEWAIYAAGLETLRGIVVNLLVKAATLHLRLLGRKTVAKAVCTPIRTTDAQLEANTESTRISNAERKRDNGWVSQDQASQEITGTDAVAEPNYNALGKAAAVVSLPPDA